MTVQTTMWEDYSTYLFTVCKLKKSKSAMYQYRSCFLSIVKEFHDKEFNLDNFITYLSGVQDKYKPSYLNNLIKSAKHIDKYLEKTGHRPFLTDFDYFTVPLEERQVLTPEEISTLLRQNTREGAKYNDILTFLWLTGCRIGEALSLTENDVVVGNPSYVVFRDTKSRNYRKVPVPHPLALRLKRSPVFGVSPTGIKRCMKKRALMAGISRPVSPHIFRHSFITEMLKYADIEYVGKIVGHKNPATTQLYNHVELKTLDAVMMYHPLYRSTLPLSSITGKIKDYILTISDPSRFSIRIEEETGELKVRIKTVINFTPLYSN